MVSKVVAIASDHAGFALKSVLAEDLGAMGHAVVDLGPSVAESVDYPDYGHALARRIAEGDAEVGLAVCGSGIGICMTLNRHRGVRAALCHDGLSARLARLHNDANVLALGERLIGVEAARDALRAFLETSFEGGRHARRVEKIDRGAAQPARLDRTPAMTRSSTAEVLSGTDGFFTDTLEESDPELHESIRGELRRQQDQIELIASENIVSRAVLEAQGSILTNKYAEGYPGRRYYAGCDHVDVAEQLAIDRAKRLFGCDFANVQPHSGAQANLAVMLALIKPGDTIMGLSLAAGGHLTHGAAPAISGKWFDSVQYGVRESDHRIDYDRLAVLATEHKPRLIIAGGSAYPRFIDFARFRDIADSVGAFLMVDMAHFAGLVAADVHPSPVPFADVTTTTTHKTLRGGRGGMILTNDPDLAKKIDSAVFPGSQGGPLVHQIAGKAAAFREAQKPEFRQYCQAMIDNAQALCGKLLDRGFDMVAGGTDTHLMLVDLRPKKVTGNIADESLERAGITCNKNAVPFDPEKPTTTSGIRLGTPAGTTRGFGLAEFEMVGDLIADVLEGLAENRDCNAAAETAAREQVLALCRRFPVYPEL